MAAILQRSVRWDGDCRRASAPESDDDWRLAPVATHRVFDEIHTVRFSRLWLHRDARARATTAGPRQCPYLSHRSAATTHDAGASGNSTLARLACDTRHFHRLARVTAHLRARRCARHAGNWTIRAR